MRGGAGTEGDRTVWEATRPVPTGPSARHHGQFAARIAGTASVRAQSEARQDELRAGSSDERESRAPWRPRLKPALRVSRSQLRPDRSRACRVKRRAPFYLAAAGLAAFRSTAGNAAIVVPDGGFAIQGSTRRLSAASTSPTTRARAGSACGASWESMEPAPDGYLTPGGPGQRRLGRPADAARLRQSRGMKVELRFTNAPGWASGRRGAPTTRPRPTTPPTTAPSSATWPARLGGGSTPTRPGTSRTVAFWNPPDPEAFTALQKVAYPAIKALDPTRDGSLGADRRPLRPAEHGYDFLRRSYQPGLKGSADVDRLERLPGRPAGVFRARRGRRAGREHAPRPALPARPDRPVRPGPQGLDHGDRAGAPALPATCRPPTAPPRRSRPTTSPGHSATAAAT